MKRIIILLVVILVAMVALGCKKQQEPAQSDSVVVVKASLPPTAEPVTDMSKKNEPYSPGNVDPLTGQIPQASYTLLMDTVRIRETPSLGGKVIGSLKKGVSVDYFANDNAYSRNTDEVAIDGIMYVAHWYKVLYEEGKMGWIYGAAIGRYITATKV